MMPRENRTHSYDALGRLSTASGPWGAGSYTYDLLNNIRSKTLGSDTVQIEYNANNQVARARDTRDGNIWRDYLHDARGNVIDNDRLSFTYDRSDQPVAMGGAVSATYAYDAHNRRVKQVIDGETIYSVYGTGGDLLYRDNITTGEETINLTLGSRPVARLITQGGLTTPTYLYPDHLGTASLAANASGYITWWESYTPFGETLNNAPQGFNQPGFTGHIRDTATGLNYMQARYYDPVIGRFLSNDPVGFAEMMAQGDHRYFNRYSYTANDPVNRHDPSGMWIESAWDVANLGIGAASLASNASQGNWGAAAVDFGGLVIDGIATAVPLVPAGAGVSIKAARSGADVASSAFQARRLENQLSAESIAEHAFERHADDLGVGSVGEARAAIEGALNSPNAFTRTASDGRSMTADPDSGIVVIRNPNAEDGGTAFRPENFDEFVENANIRPE
jgi:RHS repeat-associated protein